MIFFDIDDTLSDFETAQENAVRKFYNNTKELHNTPFDILLPKWQECEQEYFDRYIAGEFSFNEQRKERFKAMFSFCGKEIASDTAWNYFLIYEDFYENSWCLFDGAKECLEKLKENGFSLGIISNGNTNQQKKKLEKLGIIHFFDVLVTAESCSFPKPKREIFDFALKKSNEPKSSFIYVGDNFETDIKPAIEYGYGAVFFNPKERDCKNFPFAKTFKDVFNLIIEKE